MDATAHPLIPFIDFPLICVALARWRPPKGVSHQILLTPWPKGVEISITMRAGCDAPHFFRILPIEPHAIIQRLSIQAVALLQASKIAHASTSGRPKDPLDISWMGKDQ